MTLFNKIEAFEERLSSEKLLLPHELKALGSLFMAIFRRDDFQECIDGDDNVEIFQGILKGESDITLELLGELIANYSAGDNVQVFSRDQVDSMEANLVFIREKVTAYGLGWGGEKKYGDNVFAAISRTQKILSGAKPVHDCGETPENGGCHICNP